MAEDDGMMYWVWLIALGWVFCGIPAYGLTLAYLQRVYPVKAEVFYKHDAQIAMVMAVFGPVGLVASFFDGGRGHYGLMWRRPK